MKISRVTVRRTGAGEDRDRWSAAMMDLPVRAGNLLKQDGASWVRRTVVPGCDGEVVIKCRAVGSLAERFKLLTRQSRGDRQWRGAEWLRRNGFATAQPLALILADVDGSRCELFVTKFVNARSVLDHLAAADLSPKQEHAIAREMARLVVGMLAKGRCNRDGKPSNLLGVDPAGDLRIATIDTVAIRPVMQGDPTSLARMLANFMLEPMGTNCTPRRTLRARVVHEVVNALAAGASREVQRRQRRELWKQVETRIRAHGEPRPRVDPRAPSTGA